jgi:hypothetical protein
VDGRKRRISGNHFIAGLAQNYEMLVLIKTNLFYDALERTGRADAKTKQNNVRIWVSERA